MKDLRHTHPGQPQPEDQLVPSADVRAVAHAEKRSEGLPVGEPPSWVLPLQLAVQRRSGPQRVLPALELLDQCRVRLPLADAPAQEGASPSQATPTGVVGPALRYPMVDGTLGQRPWMRHAGERKQGRQLGPVLVRSLGVRVAANEPLGQLTRRPGQTRKVTGNYFVC
jgi:hypothetical protein